MEPRSIFRHQQITVEEILKSRLLCKAAIVRDGKVLIAAVFERSDFHRCFFVFEANSKRSPRKAWRFTNLYYSVNAGMGKTFESLEEFCTSDYHFHNNPIKVRYYFRKRYIKTLLDRIAHPLKYSTQTVPVDATFEYANRISTGKRQTSYQNVAHRGPHKNI